MHFEYFMFRCIQQLIRRNVWCARETLIKAIHCDSHKLWGTNILPNPFEDLFSFSFFFSFGRLILGSLELFINFATTFIESRFERKIESRFMGSWKNTILNYNACNYDELYEKAKKNKNQTKKTSWNSSCFFHILCIIRRNRKECTK